jgi:hypothetical protein
VTARVSRATASVSGARRASLLDAAERRDRLALIARRRGARRHSPTSESGLYMASSRLRLRRVRPDQPPQPPSLHLTAAASRPCLQLQGPSKCHRWDGEQRTHTNPDSHAAWAFNNRRDGGSRHYQMFEPSWSTDSHGWIQSQRMSDLLIDGRCKTERTEGPCQGCTQCSRLFCTQCKHDTSSPLLQACCAIASMSQLEPPVCSA